MKIHISVDLKRKKILSMSRVTTDEHVYDSKALLGLVEDIAKSKSMTIDKILADGTYNGNFFRCMSTHSGILP
ncbi:MAG: hypothetical protein M3Z01_01705 [Thermoproteota archaeon]|nr:hypothetical protein [Thermoproteota archaeon]